MKKEILDTLRKSKEDAYFEEKNKEAMERMAMRQSELRLSPVTGKPMVQEAMFGVIVDRCKDSNGIWLDHGELEEIAKAMESQKDNSSWLSKFMEDMFVEKK